MQYTLQYSKVLTGRTPTLSLPHPNCLINSKHELSVLSAQDCAKHWEYTEKAQAAVAAII